MIKLLGKKRIKKIHYRHSPSKTGYHLKIIMYIPDWIDEFVDNDSFLMGMRYICLDCFGRFKADLARKHLSEKMDRLSIYKDGNYSGKWIKA